MMTPTFKKLNLNSHSLILALNVPSSFEGELAALSDVQVVRKPHPELRVEFGIAFAVTKAELDEASRILVHAAQGDAVVWIAYPKGTSKRYRCEFNRDTGWEVLAQAGFEGVRQVAIDEDWSALRFRRVQFIKSLARAPERAATEVGKARTAR